MTGRQAAGERAPAASVAPGAEARWVYRIVVLPAAKESLSLQAQVDALTEFGAAGWELVTAVPVDDGVGFTNQIRYVFKRPAGETGEP